MNVKFSFIIILLLFAILGAVSASNSDLNQSNDLLINNFSNSNFEKNDVIVLSDIHENDQISQFGEESNNEKYKNISNKTVQYNSNITISIDKSITGFANDCIPVTVQVVNDNLPVQNGIVTIGLNGSSYSNNVINGSSIVNLLLPGKAGNYIGEVFYRNNGIKATTNINITVKSNTNESKSTIIALNDYTGIYGIRGYINGRITTNEGFALPNVPIGLNMTRLSTGESKIYYVNSDENGYFQRIIELKNGDYYCWAFFEGNTNYTNSESFEVSMVIILPDYERFTDLTTNYDFNGEVIGRLTYFYDKPLKGENIQITIYDSEDKVQNIINCVTNTNGEFIFNLVPGSNFKVLIEYFGSIIGDISYVKSYFYLTIDV